MAINALARRGAREPTSADYVFAPATFALGLTLDVADIGQTLELLDELDAPPH